MFACISPNRPQQQGSAAAKSGIIAGDELLAVNLRAVRTLHSPQAVESLLQQRSDRSTGIVMLISPIQ